MDGPGPCILELDKGATPAIKKYGKVLRKREPAEHRSLAMTVIWGKRWVKVGRSILTGTENA